jgi:hypothetical protein
MNIDMGNLDRFGEPIEDDEPIEDGEQETGSSLEEHSFYYSFDGVL